MFDGHFRIRRRAAGCSPVGANLAQDRHHRRPPHRRSACVMAVGAAVAIGTGALRAGLLLLVLTAVPDVLDGAVAKASGTARPVAPSSTRSPTASPTPCCSAASPGTSPTTAARPHRRAAPRRPRLPRCSSPTSGPRPSPSASTPGAGSWSGPSASSLLGFGLLFDSLLIAVLWVMLALTAVTAVQRFVKVWRQASAAAPAESAGRGPLAGPREPPAPTERVARCRRRSAAVRAQSASAAGPDSWPPHAPRRTSAGSAVVRGRCPAPVAGARRRRSAGARRRRHAPASGAPHGRAQPAPGPRPRLSTAHALRRAVAARPSSPTPATGVESFRLPGTSAPRSSTPAWPSTGCEHIDGRRRPRATGVDPGPAPPRRLGVGGLLARRGCGHVTVTAVVEPLEPAGAVRVVRRPARAASASTSSRSGPTPAPAVLRGAAGQPASLCLLCDRDLAGGGVEVEFFGERTTLPGGPATLALRTGAPLLPAAVYFEGDGQPRRRPARRSTPTAPGQAARRRRPRHPGPRPRARGADPAGARAVAPPPAQLAQRPRRAGDRRRPRGDGPMLGVRSGWSARTASPSPAACRRRCSAWPAPLRAKGHDARVLAPVRRPAARGRGHPARQQRPDRGQRLGRAARARPVGAAAHASGPLRDEDFDVLHLHEPLAPGPTHDRAARSSRRRSSARSTRPA